jgi:mono/diheme cytochrome c family protein
MTRHPRPHLVRAALSLVVFLPACSLLPPIDFERMIYQDRFTVWQRCRYLPRGQVLQPPPEGTVPRDAPVGAAAVLTGIDHGGYDAEIPIPVTRDLLLAGRKRFEIYCAACHGLSGDGVSIVAENMDLRRPPAIAGPAARSLPPGRIYQVVDEGYGLMRSYAEDLVSPEERWSVVAYLRALQLSRGVNLDSLPPDVRREAERELR